MIPAPKIPAGYSIVEVAQIFGKHRNTVENWIKRGNLKPLRNVHPKIITPNELNRFLAR